MPVHELIFFIVRGFLLTLSFETPVLLVGLSGRYSVKEKLFAALWLNACSYPLVSLAIPFFIDPYRDRFVYLLVAETVAPVFECLIFWLAFARKRSGSKASTLRDLAAIVLANLFSFGIGEFVLYKYNLLR